MAERLHLQPKHRQMLESLLRKHLPEVEVWAYGSRVTGRSHDGSDLDLVLRGPGLEKIPIGQLADFEEAVRESNVPFLVEARDWARLPERFHREIGRDHVSVVRPSRREVTLGEVAEFQEGYVNPPQSKAEYFDGPIKWLRASDLNNSFVYSTSRTLSEDGYRSAGKSASLFPPDTLAISKSGTIGRLGILKDWMCGNRAVINVKPLEPLADTRYVFYALMSDPAQIDVLADGSVQRNLYVSQLSTFRMSLPDFPEQRAIAHILSALDDRIELNRRLNETLESMARALFKSWFVDFEPVRAKVDGRDTGLPLSTEALFPAQIDQVDARNAPVGWRTYRLDEIVDHHTATVSPSATPEALFEHFSIPAFDAGQTQALEFGADIRSNKTLVPHDAVLLSKLNPDIPRVWAPSQPDSATQICSTEFLAFAPSAPASRSLLFSLFSDHEFRTKLRSLVTGTSKSHQRVPPKSLKAQLVISGEPEVFQAFDDLAAPWLNRMIANRTECQSLAATRDALLPKLVSGEIRIADAQKAVESVI